MFFSLDKLSKWLSSKSPRKKRFILSQRNIYIFPSSFGFCFLVLLLLMLLTAINYQSSLIYLLTFFLGSIFFLSIWACFLNFSGLIVEAMEPGRCFENELIHYNYRISKSKGLPLSLKVGLNKENAESLPFEDNTFDCVSIAFGLRNVTNKDVALQQMYRVLKKGGTLLILEFSKVENEMLKKIYDLYSFNVIPKFGEFFANDEDSYQYLAESIRKHPDQETLKSMALDAGFGFCEYHNLTGGIVALHKAIKT